MSTRLSCVVHCVRTSKDVLIIRVYNTYDEPMIYISVSDEHMTYQSRGSVLFESYVLIFRPALVQI